VPLTGFPGPKKLKRSNLAISSLKTGQILKNEKRSKRSKKAKFSTKKIVKTSFEVIIS